MKKNFNYILLIFMVSFNLRLGISSVSPLITVIKKDLSLTNFQASLLTSIPVICMGIFAFCVIFFEQRFGKKNSIFFLLLLLGLGTLSRSIFTNYFYLLFTAFIIGFCVAIIGPLLSGFIKQEFPENSGLLIGIYSLAMGLGSTFASGFASILAAIFWKNKVTNDSSTTKDDQKIHLPLRNTTAWKMSLFFGIQSGIFYSLITWLVEFFKFKEMSNQESVILLTAFTAMQMAFSFIIPAVMDKFDNNKVWIYICYFSMIGGMLLLSSYDRLEIFLFAVLLLAFSTGGLFPIALLLPLKFVHSPVEASVWTSMIQAFGYMIGGIVPILIGVLIDATDNLNYLVYSIIIGILFILVLNILLPNRKVNNKNVG
ncbi:CynX/NimT family MFS transporter [Enterococcus hailinensis]|uniref:MFS transporter n=1 Tax=Enterococcus hailinensis TaxID=3238988 RepID=UPI0038B26FAF